MTVKGKTKRNKKNFFERFSSLVTKASGSPAAFISALAIIVVWAVSGPLFNYSDTWQLVINTGTTIITFLMVFIIQQSQNKDTTAIHLKLNELIASSEKASNHLIDIEDMTEEELAIIKKFYIRLSKLADEENDLHTSHSLDEADSNHQQKAKTTKQKT